MTTSDHQVIDVHAHVIFPESEGFAGELGPESGVDADGCGFYRIGEYRTGTNYRGSAFSDLDLRLAAMDEAGIGIQMLSSNPLTFYHQAPAAAAASFTRRVNDLMKAAVTAYPDRFVGSAVLPMQDPDAALRELEHGIGELGLAAVYVGSDFGDLSDTRYDELVSAIAEYDVPVFFHPSSTGGVGLPDDVRLRDRDMGLMVGYAYEEALTIARLVFSDLLVRHPNLKLVFSHGGGAIPWLHGKLATAGRVRAWVPEHVREHGVDHYLRMLWYDVHVGDRAARDLLVARFGTEQLLFGTNFVGWDSGAGRDEGELMPTLSANARRLLKLDGA